MTGGRMTTVPKNELAFQSRAFVFLSDDIIIRHQTDLITVSKTATDIKHDQNTRRSAFIGLTAILTTTILLHL